MARISLVMSGAVSLGSYHAGVLLTELLYCLDSHRRAGKPYEFDVATGASAGAITGAIVAYAVMNNFARRDGLHKAWVELASIDRTFGGPPPKALLSGDAVRAFARDCMPPPLAVAAPASFAPARMHLGFTLSNLTGRNRRVEVPNNPGGGRFDSTFFDDVRTYRVTRGAPDGAADAPRRDWAGEAQATWDDVTGSAIASGSFPLAFPPALLPRRLWEMAQLADPVPDPLAYLYVDGGTFNNQPIGQAVRLSHEADDRDPGPGRKYLFVNAAAANDDLGPDSSLLDIGRRLVNCIFAQSRTSDWTRTLLTDTRIRWRDSVFDMLTEMARDQTVSDPAALVERMTALARQIVPASAARPGSFQPADGFAELLARTERRFAHFLGRLPADGSRRREFLTLQFLLPDNVAALDTRGDIDIWTVSPPTGDELAGTQPGWFGRFPHRRRLPARPVGRRRVHDPAGLGRAPDPDARGDRPRGPRAAAGRGHRPGPDGRRRVRAEARRGRQLGPPAHRRQLWRGRRRLRRPAPGRALGTELKPRPTPGVRHDKDAGRPDARSRVCRARVPGHEPGRGARLVAKDARAAGG